MILGIDPGLASTGFGVVERHDGRLRAVEWGVIRTRPATPHAQRLVEIHQTVAALLVRYPIDAAAIESWFIHPVSKAAMGMAESRGAVLVAIASAGVEVVEYSPNTIKQSVTGNGRRRQGAGPVDGRAPRRGRPGNRPRQRCDRRRAVPFVLLAARRRHPARPLASQR